MPAVSPQPRLPEPDATPDDARDPRTFTEILRDVWSHVEAVNAKTAETPLVPPSDRPLPSRGGWSKREKRVPTMPEATVDLPAPTFVVPPAASEPQPVAPKPVEDPIPAMPPPAVDRRDLDDALHKLAKAIDASWDDVEIVTPKRLRATRLGRENDDGKDA